ncbi:glycine-rich cell wall structural protein-like [Helianthus annuus]|uniref:glycine-rich cell wall structural protein-like n=1 Tax=Helianthus annuus TaxID=4232 RepID=UPI000B8F92C9|nr:glycine-rich cell wall structural protein-like [Helianthus annuus]
MKFKSFVLLCYLFVLVVLVSSNAEVETSKDETNVDKAQEEYHVNDGYGGGGWGDYNGGGYGGPGGGWGGYRDGWGGRGGGYGGGWGGRGGGYGGGWGGRRGGRWGCSFGCCGGWYRYRGCRQCCRSLTEAITFNEQEATP